MRKIVVLSCAMIFAVSAKSACAIADSAAVVREVVVVGNGRHTEAVVSQRIGAKEIERTGSRSVADAMRYFAGVQIKDYGGVGGVKTVDIRSMGSNHLGVYYDGVEIGNAQNGQTDLGQLSLDNIEAIELYNGQKGSIFMPASNFAGASSVYIQTRKPRFADSNTTNLNVKGTLASSDTYRLSMLAEHRFSPRLSGALSIGGLLSSGRYRFRYRRKNQDGTVAYDTTAVRQNGDIWAMRAEANLFGTTDGGEWAVKAYTYNSERGIPGAIVNNVWRRGERQWDHNNFVQAYFATEISTVLSAKWLAKYAYYNTRYVNNDSTKMIVDNRYSQHEAYLSASAVAQFTPWLSASAAYDFKWNKLGSDMPRFVYPHRYTNMLSVASAVSSRYFKAQASVVGVAVADHTEKLVDKPSAKVITPAVYVSYFPFGTAQLVVRAFAKRSFRMPTFNDLYYTDMGNAMLKPEKAMQLNVGFSSTTRWAGIIRQLNVRADAYINNVDDKIVAYPKGEQFRWTMLNLGKVRIKGVDTEVEMTAHPAKGLVVTGRLQYTYQKAYDITDPSTSYYGHQIPYVPWHSGSATLNAEWGAFNINYSFIYAGERYSQRENIRFNHVQPWYTSDVAMTCKFAVGGTVLRVSAEVNNLFSQDYDVILNYPMPKRNYSLSVAVDVFN